MLKFAIIEFYIDELMLCNHSNNILNSEFNWRFSFENVFKNVIEYWPVVSHLMASGWLQGSESDKVVDGR